jgi:hypothetical protein
MWDDQIKQVSGLEAAGGLNRSLILKASGTGGPVFQQPASVSKAIGSTLTPEEVMSRFISVTGTGGTEDITLPSAVAVAAYLNGGAASRNGTKLWVGASFYLTIKGVSDGIELVGGTGWTVDVGGATLGWFTTALGSATYICRFTDVTVGAETITAYPMGGQEHVQPP